MSKSTQPTQSKSKEEIAKWVAVFLADLLELKEEGIDFNTRFDRYGLDSSVAVGVTDALGKWMGQDLSPTLLYDFPTIDALATHLAHGAGKRA